MTGTTKPPKGEFLADIVVTAAEGGINYWAHTRNYKVHYVDDSGVRVSIGDTVITPYSMSSAVDSASIEVLGREGSEPKEWTTVNGGTVRKGINALKEMEFRRDLKMALLYADNENDAGEVDSELADCIVQAGLFGKLVYG